MNLSIILPIFNEENVVEQSIKTILHTVDTYCNKLEIVAINDGSVDNTATILKLLQRKDKRIKVINHEENKGYGAALRSGMHHASYEWIFFTDADMQFNIQEIDKFIKMRKNYDFIAGFRKNRADPLKRKIISYIYNRIIRYTFGLPLKDVDCAFKLMRKSAVKQIPFYSDSFFVSVELMTKAYKNNFRILEIGVSHFPRIKGVSKVTSKQIIYTVFDLAKLYRSQV